MTTTVDLINDKANAVRQLLAHLDVSLTMIAMAGDRGGDSEDWRDVLETLHRMDQTVASTIGTATTAARAYGLLSWAEVGAALEVSKQAAQQRFGA